MIVQKAKIARLDTDALTTADIFPNSVPEVGKEVYIRANSVGMYLFTKQNGRQTKIWACLSSDMPRPVMVPVGILEFTNEFNNVE